MFITEILVAVVVGLILSGLFYILFRTSEGWIGLTCFFLLVFLAAWTGGVSVRPYGPRIYELYWMPYLMSGLVIALILSLFIIPPPDIRTDVTVKPEELAVSAKPMKRVRILHWPFWLLVFLFALILFVHYFTNPGPYILAP